MGTFLLMVASFALGLIAGHFREELRDAASRALAKLRAWRAKP